MSSDPTSTPEPAPAPAPAPASAPSPAPAAAPSPAPAQASAVEDLLAQLTRQLASPGGADWLKEASRQEGLVNIFDLASGAESGPK